MCLFIVACGEEPLEMKKFIDNYMNDAFEEALRAENIEYRRNGQQIFYRVSDREKVNTIADEVLETNAPKSQIFLKGYHSKVVDELKNSGVRYKEIQTDTGPALTWPDEQDKLARYTIRRVLDERL